MVRSRARRAEAERLLAASGRVARLCSLDACLVGVAAEALGLAGPGVAICCATGTDGRWLGVLVDADGARQASEELVDAVRALADAHDDPVVLDVAPEPLATRLALPPGATLALAPAGADAPVPLVLAIVGDAVASGAADLLGRFTTAAALAVGNARLFEQIESAYRQQLELHRQKDEFVATVSHELRTPVAAIRGTIETMVRVGDRLDGERRAVLLDGALSYSARLERTIEELLLVATTERPSGSVVVTEVDVATLLDEVVVATMAVTEGRVVALGAPVLRTLSTDHHKLRTILVHLVENAGKFATDGVIELEAVAAGSRAVFYVSDHGPGIAPADRERVFERFVQLDQSATRNQGGLGLGLYLARQLAGVLGGELVTTEAPGGGACFCLAIDRSLVAPRRANARAAAR